MCSLFIFDQQGVAEIYHSSLPNQNIVEVPSVERFSKDYNRIVELVSEGAMRSFCFQRLQMLSTSFKMHTTINRTVEQEEQNSLLGTDFYRTLKIDNHIHAAAAPSAKQFVEFVRRKLESEGDTVVNHDGRTLTEVFKAAGIDKDHLTIDAFNVLADYSVYQRFDNFNRYSFSAVVCSIILRPYAPISHSILVPSQQQILSFSIGRYAPYLSQNHQPH